MRRTVALAILCMPAVGWAGTNTIGVDYGNAAATSVDCPAIVGAKCERSDTAWRGYYEYTFDNRIGLRATHTEMNDVKLTESPQLSIEVDSWMDDLAVTYSFVPTEFVTIRLKGGLAYWQEQHSSVTFFGGPKRTGYSPDFGASIDFGTKLLRFGISADVYPSVGDSGYVRYFGAGIRFVW